MAIVNVVQSGNMVIVYNENNSGILTLQGKLHGFTGSTVSVRYSTSIVTYNEKGSVISTIQG